MIANLLQGSGLLTPQYMKIIEIARKAKIGADNLGQQIDFTGHSLGGGLASLGALITNENATTFNAAGLHRNYRYLYSVIFKYDKPAEEYAYPQYIPDNTRHPKKLINAIYVQGEILSRIQDNTPGILPSATGMRIELQRGSSDGSFSQHGSNNVCRALGSACDYSEGGNQGYVNH